MAFEVTLVPKENIELGVTQKAVFTLSNVTPTIPVPGPKGDKGDKGDTGPQGPQGLPGTGVNTTDDIPEGDINLYYTEERVEGVIAANVVLATGTTNGLLSSSDYTKLQGIAAGAEVNVNADWNATSGDAAILNKPATFPPSSHTHSDATTSVDGFMSATDKTKLDGIASGAEVNVQANWTETNVASDAFILNKPSTFPPSTHTHPDATTSVSGFMSSTDKTKLDGIQAGAEVNVNADWNATSGDAQILNKPTVVSSVGANAPITSSGGTNPTISTSMTSNRLIGRGSAGSGVMEEISIGTGLQLSGTTLSATGTSAGGGITKATANGTDTYTATITGVSAYSDGDTFLIRFTNGNTTGSTLNINSLGAKTLYKNNDGAVVGGDIGAGSEMLCVFNSTLNGFQCIGTSPNSLFAYVGNAESITITKGQPVYAFGATGDRLTVKLANNTGDATSAQTIGLVMSDSIAAGQKGFIIVQGQLDNLSLFNPSSWADGDPVYLGATAGTLTKTKPSAPNHLVYLGTVVTTSNGNAGRMYVRVQNGYELQELHNVALSNPPANNDGLFYESSTSLWKNKSIPTVLGYTPEPAITSGTTGQYWRGDKSWQTLDKAAVGLGNVDNTSDANKPISSATQTALNAKIDANTAITGATKTKITYDSKGLVTAGTDATTADIADSSNKRYVTDAQLTVIGNTSGTNTGDQNIFGTIVVAGQSNVVADATNDTLTLVAGTGVSITTNATTDSITINSSTNLSLDDITASSPITIINDTGTDVSIPLASSLSSGLISGTQYDKLDALSTARQLPPLGSTGQVLGKISGSDYAVGWIDNVVDGSVTMAKMANIATNTLIGRLTASTGVPEVLSIGSGLAGSGTTLYNTLMVGAGSNQTVIGGGNASGTLTLSSTSNATKGKILFGTSGYDESTNRLGVGTSSPAYTLDVRGNQQLLQTVTATSGSVIAFNMQNTLSPATNSSATHRVLNMSNTINASGVNFTGVELTCGWFENRLTNAGTVNEVFGAYFAGLIAGSAAASLTSLTNVYGLNVYSVNSFSNSLTATITNAYGIRINNAIKNTFTVTNSVGLQVLLHSTGSNNTNILINNSIPSGNWSIYNNSTNNNYFNGNLYIGSTTDSGFKLDVNGTARFQNDVTISDTRNIILSTSTGTKIGTATGQKLAFWNKTPIVQPTTSVGSAAFTANTGTAINDASTFAGYTIAKVVQALQDIGILA